MPVDIDFNFKKDDFRRNFFLLVRYYQQINPEMKPQQRVPVYYE